MDPANFIAQRAVLGPLGYSWSHSILAAQNQARHQAEIMNMQLREAMARRMDPIRAGFEIGRYHQVMDKRFPYGLTQDMIVTASAVGKCLAGEDFFGKQAYAKNLYVLQDHFEKEAFPAAALAKPFKAVAGAGSRMVSKFRKPKGPALPKVTPPPKGDLSRFDHPVFGSNPEVYSATTAEAAKATSKANDPSFWDKAKKYITPGRLLTAGLVGAGMYGTYRLGQSGINYLGTEQGPVQRGNPYMQPAPSVNQWGQPL